MKRFMRLALPFVSPLIAVAAIGCWVATPSPQTFDNWYAEHKTTCPECGGGPDRPMCVEAFEKMQESLK